MLRLAILSDVHANLVALQAVLEDIQRCGGVDGYWILGDLAAIGPEPEAVLERLVALPNASYVRGNTDRYIVSGDLPPPTRAEVRAAGDLLPQFEEIVRSFSWTQGAVTATGWLRWLEALPLEQRMALPDGTRLMGVHASPGCDDGPGLRPDMTDKDLCELLAGSAADLVCVGHTHLAFRRQLGSTQVVNVGSLSNPFPPDLRATYVVLAADEIGYRVERRWVDYDRQRVIDTLQQLRHPAADFITRRLQGRLPARRSAAVPWAPHLCSSDRAEE